MLKETKVIDGQSVTVIEENERIVAVTLDEGDSYECESAVTPACEKALGQIEEYFHHKRMLFTFDWEAPPSEDFEADIYQMIQSLPYGETFPLECIAEGLKIPLNEDTKPELIAVIEGNILPLVIPCHRLADEDLHYPFGEDVKEKLIRLEREPLEM